MDEKFLDTLIEDARMALETLKRIPPRAVTAMDDKVAVFEMEHFDSPEMMDKALWLVNETLARMNASFVILVTQEKVEADTGSSEALVVRSYAKNNAPAEQIFAFERGPDGGIIWDGRDVEFRAESNTPALVTLEMMFSENSEFIGQMAYA